MADLHGEHPAQHQLADLVHQRRKLSKEMEGLTAMDLGAISTTAHMPRKGAKGVENERNRRDGIDPPERKGIIYGVVSEFAMEGAAQLRPRSSAKYRRH